MSSINNTNSLNFRAVGRYMTGSTVTAYHLVGSNGIQKIANKEQLIYMIGRGLVENMRVQADGIEIRLRGKGVNLNKLPIYDEVKKGFRGNKASQDVASTLVKPKKDSGVNPMGQLKIVKRIMHKTRCLGYVVEDLSGKQMRLRRQNVMDLAIQKLISNATAQLYKAPGEKSSRIVIKGAGCELSQLPSLFVDSTGKIVDPEPSKGELKVRATKMKKGGILHDNATHTKIPFETGDYLLVGVKGVIRPLKSADMANMFSLDKSASTAICDEYLENVKNYPIEIFGSTARELKPEQILKWAVVSSNKASL